MARKTKAYLAALWIDGFVPKQGDFADLFDSCVRDYGSYVILATQTSTNPPTVSKLETDLTAGTPAWARTSAGVYTATLTGGFPANKTVIFYKKDTGVTSVIRTDANTITVTCTGDGILNEWSLQIRVYN